MSDETHASHAPADGVRDLSKDETPVPFRALLGAYDRQRNQELQSARVQLHESEEKVRECADRFRFLAESMPLKVFTAQPNGGIDYFNRHSLDFTGLSFEEIRDWRWTQFIHPDDLEENLRRWKHSIETGDFFEFEHRIRRADGEWLWHLSLAHAMHDADGRVLMWIGSSTEIDEVKRAHAKAEQASRAKDQFLAALSHELRTPLTPVLLCAGALERETALQPEYREQLGMMRRNLELEARLIDDLLDLNRISQGKLQLDLGPADVHKLLAHSEQIVRRDLCGKRIDLCLKLEAGEHHVLGDPGRLQQVFWNVLNNAIKFTPTGGEIIIRTRNPAAGEILVEFTDTGIGIEPEFLAAVFSEFVQAEASPGRASGLGIGMWIAKTIVELHGGVIAVASPGVGRGTRFTVELATIATDVKREISSPPPSSVSPRPYRLLLVEDHQPTIEILARLLRKRGYEVITASTVAAARDFAASQKFDLVISDIGLPDGNGVDLMIELTRGYGLRGIALSGYGLDEDVARTRNAGFIAHLVKPIDFDHLNRVLDQATAQQLPV